MCPMDESAWGITVRNSPQGFVQLLISWRGRRGGRVSHTLPGLNHLQIV